MWDGWVKGCSDEVVNYGRLWFAEKTMTDSFLKKVGFFNIEIGKDTTLDGTNTV